MHREEILTNLNWQGKLKIECGPSFTTEMGVEHLEIYNKSGRKRNHAEE
jgi:hypothetical protein